MLKEKRVYVATLFRLIVIPAILILSLFGLKELFNIFLNSKIENTVLYLTLFYVATPFGLNTIVFPEAYGGDSSIGVGMTLISHTAAVITIPIMYVLMVAVFGPVAIL